MHCLKFTVSWVVVTESALLFSQPKRLAIKRELMCSRRLIPPLYIAWSAEWTAVSSYCLSSLLS